MTEQTIGLCMIVRDEAEIIERCLASVRDLIDTWTIVDTGSEDETPELIERALADVPGTLHRRPWRDFGSNRTELMELARGSADYLLLIDADMTVKQYAPLPQLEADAYLLRHLGRMDYAVPRLIRGDRAWNYVGTTHEYLASDRPFERRLLDELAIVHHLDAGRRWEKHDRDVRLLEKELRRDPENVRATFYLAQTLRDMGETERALELYRRRVELGGWDQEVFYAAYQIGAVTAREDPLDAIRPLLEAYAMRPTRAEPLHLLARICRDQGWHEAAYAFARQGAEIPYPRDILFVHREPYEWGLLFELSIAAYWTGHPEEALEITDRLLAERDIPSRIEVALRRNRRFSEDALAGGPGKGPTPSQAIEPLSSLVPSLEIGQIRLVTDPAWPQFNPTIAPDGDGFRMIVRTSNYRVGRDGYEPLDPDGLVRTINYLVRLDRSLEMTGVEPILDETDMPRYVTPVLGYEDCRLVEVDGSWYALAAARDRNPDALAEVFLLSLEEAKIAAARRLPGPDPARSEKNWVPFAPSRDGKLRLLYSCRPTVVFECDVRTGELATVSEHDGPAAAEGFRGGSQGLAVDGGHVFVVHEVLSGPVAGRAYAHRLVLIDEDHRLAALTPRFSFTGDDLEYCLGLVRRDDDLILAFGVLDRVAGLAVCSEDQLLELLQPVEVRGA